MAAAIIPLVTAVLPAAIPTVVRLVEQLLGRGNGPVKQDLASQVLEAAQAALASLKVVDPASALTTPQIKTLIEAAVADLNKRGELQGAGTVIEPTVSEMRRRLADVMAILDLIAKR